MTFWKGWLTQEQKDKLTKSMFEQWVKEKEHIHKHRGIDSKCQYCEQEKKEIDKK